MGLAYDLDKIKFATDRPTFEKAVGIYETGGVKDLKDTGFGFAARVRGSGGNFYQVYVSAKDYDAGGCDCYLGQNETLCKHMVAVAIGAVKSGQQLTGDDKKLVDSPKSSGRLGQLEKRELTEVKAKITSALRYVKPYNGPSRIWFQYQNSLSEGCNRLAKIVSELPVSRQTAELLVDTLLRLERKISGGVDDSDGTVGGFMEEVVIMLKDYVKHDAECLKTFCVLENKETSFGWEEPLVEMFNEQ